MAFSHDTFDMRIEEHPVVCRMPQPTRGPSTQPISHNDFRSFAASPYHPITLEEMIHQNAPPIFLHVTSFNDATLVAISWPHVLMDEIGHKELLEAWSLVLAGREEDVPDVLGVQKDILDGIGLSDDAGLGLDQKRLKGMAKTKYISRNLWDRVFNPSWELRAIFLPKEAFVRLRTRSQGEIAHSYPGGDPKPNISDEDILTAWITRAMASSMPKPRPITILTFSNARFRLPSLFGGDGVYLQNLMLGVYTFLSVEIARGPLGMIALSHRKHLDDQNSEAQTRSLLNTWRQDIESTGSPSLFYGEPQGSVMLVNNLNKAEIIKAARFGPAVVKQGDKAEGRKNPPGRMVTYYIHSLGSTWTGLNCLWMLGRDHGGNYCLQANLLPKAWAAIEEDIRDMSIII